MSAPTAILDLVARFEEHLEVYKSGTYNETQLRRDFLDPFLKELGWDIDNENGYAEAYRDVVHEDHVRVGGVLKAPDYGFRIGGNRKFFLEAKKPSVRIRDEIPPAYQLRRYAWSAKLPLSILTDFEEFAVYDCRIKPDPNDPASKARIFLCDFREYAAKWSYITSIFSKDAILKGSFDKYAETNKSKRGTTEVDSDFLATIEQWRADLARNLALRNNELSTRELNFAVQAILDRIIFLRICEDRGIEVYQSLLRASETPGIYRRLTDLFRQADARYNSGLFHFKTEKDRHEAADSLTLGLKIDDELLRKLLRGIYYPESPYEFSVIGADILGQVYEQFLGKVIRLTDGHRAIVDDKPEVKKAGGVYYTPTYIVEYIVCRTLAPLLEKKSPKTIATLRIVDPSCGSGSFLIGVYQFLLDWYQRWYSENEPKKWAKGKSPALATSSRGGWQLTTAERKRILIAHVYGVDIDSQAVEVTKLSLLLKVLEGETENTVQRELIHDRVLPDLANNIKCGNSLIDSGFYAQSNLPEIDTETSLLINSFDWNGSDGFPDIMASGGFDAIVGNPPYGAYLSLIEASYLAAQFSSQNYQLDTYLLFMERAMRLARNGGRIGLIIPNTWLLNLQTVEIRRHVFSTTKVCEIVHFTKKVFPKVTVDTEICIFEKGKPTPSQHITITISDTQHTASSHTIPQSRWQLANGKPVNVLECDEVRLISERMSMLPKVDDYYVITQGSKPFQVGKGIPKQTRKTVDEKPFVADAKKDKSFRPLLRGSLIHKYQIRWNQDYWISFGDWLAEPRYSASHDAPEKIVIRQTGDSLIATLDRDKFIARDNLYTIIPRNIDFSLLLLLAILNSRFASWYYQKVLNPEKGEALAQVKRGHIAALPLPKSVIERPLDRCHDRLKTFVEQILALYKKRAVAHTPHEQSALDRQITSTEAQIDRQVYALYDLTETEILLIESEK